MFLTGVIAISFAAIFVRLAEPAPPIVTGFYRMLFATLGIGGWLLLRRVPIWTDRPSGLLALLAGVAFGLDLSFWHLSIAITPVAVSTLLVNTQPIYVGLWSVLVWRERAGPALWAGAALAGLGTWLLVGLDELGSTRPTGAGLALAAAGFYAAYLLLMSVARRGLDAAPAMALMAASATLTLGVTASLRGEPFTGFPASSWLALLGLAIWVHGVGVMGVVWSLRYLPATLASVALLGQPLGTALWGWLLLDEALAPLQLGGGAAVLLGIGLASRSSQPRPPPPSG